MPLAQYQTEQTSSIATIEAAQAAQQHAASENARIERQYAEDEQACSTLFFVNACRGRTKERRRVALEPVHRMQIEADTQMRRIQAAERDQGLADKRRKQALEATKKEQETQQKSQGKTLKQTRIAEKNRQQLQNEPLRIQQGAHRATSQQARQQHLQVESAAEAQKRAGNVAAYERKIKAAEAHQRDLAAKKAEKNRHRKMQPLGPQPPEPTAATP